MVTKDITFGTKIPKPQWVWKCDYRDFVDIDKSVTDKHELTCKNNTKI